MKKDNCIGCYNNDYNSGLGGSKECWSFKDAKMIKRIPIRVDQRPPYNKSNAKKMPNCFNSQRMCYVSPEVLDDKGFWR